MKATENEVALANLAVQMMKYYEKLSKNFFHEIVSNEIDCRLSKRKFDLFFDSMNGGKKLIRDMDETFHVIAASIEGKDAFPYDNIRIGLVGIRNSAYGMDEHIQAMEKVSRGHVVKTLSAYKDAYSKFAQRTSAVLEVCRTTQQLTLVPDLPVLFDNPELKREENDEDNPSETQRP